MALRATIVEGKGNFQEDRHKTYVETMRALWKEISDLADYDKVKTAFFLQIKKTLLNNFPKLF